YDIRKYQSMNLEMAKDGFHPSKEIYQIWGKEVSDRILEWF
ncbi:SGNH/GDSL hydrolase family protein, partial [Acinetobacter sp. 207]